MGIGVSTIKKPGKTAGLFVGATPTLLFVPAANIIVAHRLHAPPHSLPVRLPYFFATHPSALRDVVIIVQNSPPFTLIRIRKFTNYNNAKNDAAEYARTNPDGLRREKLEGYLVYAEHCGWLDGAPPEHRRKEDVPDILHGALNLYWCERVVNNKAFYNRYRYEDVKPVSIVQQILRTEQVTPAAVKVTGK